MALHLPSLLMKEVLHNGRVSFSLSSSALHYSLAVPLWFFGQACDNARTKQAECAAAPQMT